MASTSTDFIAYYAGLTRVAYSTVCPIQIAIGTCGAILGCIVFGHNTMRKNPSAVYFIAFNIFNCLIMLIPLMTLAVQNGLNFRLIYQNAPWCKIYNFFSYALPALSRYCIVLNSIDRALITSSNASMRRRSTHRLAIWLITGMIFMVVLFHVHILVGFRIDQVSPGQTTCHAQAGAYYYFVVYSNSVVNVIIPLLLMTGFAIKTLSNLKRVRIQPTNVVSTVANTHQSRDRQFTILLLTEVGVYLLFGPLITAFNLYIITTQSQTKSNYQKGIEQYLQAILGLCSYIPPTISFYQNLIVSTAFRHTAMKIFFNRCQQRPLHGTIQANENIAITNRSNQQ